MFRLVSIGYTKATMREAVLPVAQRSIRRGFSQRFQTNASVPPPDRRPEHLGILLAAAAAGSAFGYILTHLQQRSEGVSETSSGESTDTTL